MTDNPVRRNARTWSDASGVLHMRAVREVRYSVHHTSKPVFDSSEDALADVLGEEPVLLIADATVAQLYGKLWRAYTEQRTLRVLGELILPVSESLKTWGQVDGMCSYAARCGLPRNGLIVAVGGGVLLDAAGLAAAVFRRGIGYVRIPTTLVGMVDVAVGIKQAVNAHGKKNLMGAFYAPVASINDRAFLQTLPARELSCGMAEMIKMALIRDASLFDAIEKHGRELLFSHFSSPPQIARDILFRAELLMMEELAPNLFEEQHARLVDFGHTFSPSIEIGSSYQISHGHAVAIDMLLSIAIAVARGVTPVDLLTRVLALLRKLGLELSSQCVPDTATLLGAVEEAKRHRGGCLNLITIERPGCPLFLQELSRAEAEWARKSLLSLITPQRVSAACSGFIEDGRSAL
ncbi:MAG: iron-containing alcohol dehydrogenase [Acidobacteriaceae bacterium]|nr:iron-containing alcohol dehydrogenase [Acidobacteriaceae bacterium]MBV8573012.1 iron-containing alcohol dehydrogenase [Acidobacteriaceae bacterium]